MSGFARLLPFCALSLCLAMPLLPTSVWGQVYTTAKIGLADYNGEAPAVAPSFANDGSGVVLGIEIGTEPGDSGIGYSVGYGRYPYGEETASTMDIGLKYVPSDGSTWYDFSLGRGSFDAGSAIGLTAGIYAEFESFLAGSAFVPYGGLGLTYSSIEYEEFAGSIDFLGSEIDVTVSCERDSPISPNLEAGARRAIGDKAELKIGLTYFTQSIEAQCKNTQQTAVPTVVIPNTTYEVKNKGLVMLISYKRTF